MTDKSERCVYCGGKGKFQIVSPVADHAWADCFCTRASQPRDDVREMMTFCNKCGFTGPPEQADNHKRPSDGGMCRYVGSVVPAPTIDTALAPTTQGTAMTEEWCINMAKAEGDAAIGAGMPNHPLRAAEQSETERLAVTQADRESAATYWDIDNREGTGFAAMIRGGHADEYNIVQAFARHRITAASASLDSDEVKFILGRPCFMFIREAKLFRELGYDIPTQAEAEQAFFIHRWLKFYLEHGEKWREVAEADIREHVEKARAKLAEGEGK